MSIKLLIFAATIVAGCLLVYPFLRTISVKSEWTDDAAQLAVKQLRSSSEAERRTAKARLIELGPQSIPPLVALLEYLMNDRTPIIMRGSETQAAEALERHEKLVKTGDNPEAVEALLQVSDFTVNWRLRTDACELLGELHAEESIPTLIDLMGIDESVGNSEQMYPEMEALVSIGEPAVPSLIEAVETAEEKCTVLAMSEDHPVFTAEAKKRMSDFCTFQIQARAAMVLGRIGDQRALPVLERLLTSTRQDVLKYYLKNEIERIEKKNQ